MKKLLALILVLFLVIPAFAQKGGLGLDLGLSLGNSGAGNYLSDTFTTDRLAGAVNGTAAEPGPGTRVVVASGGGATISISSGNLVLVGDGANWFNCIYNFHSASIARAAGKIYIFAYTEANQAVAFGLSKLTNGLPYGGDAPLSDMLGHNGNGPIYIIGAGGTEIRLSGDLAVGTTYYFPICHRATAGAFYFAKGGAFTNQTLLYVGTRSTADPIYPWASTPAVTNNVYPLFKVPTTLWLPSPIISDGCGGTYPTTDGLGHAEGVAGGLGAGGSGKTWTATGTWDNTTVAGKLSCTALDGGIGILVSDVSKTDCYHKAALTRAGDVVGVVCNYVNADNYIRGIHDGTNVKLIKRVAGVETEVVSAAAAYSASAELVVRSIGTSYYIFYNNSYIGSATIADAGPRAGTKVGLYTTNTGNTGDNVVAYSSGTDGAYDFLNQFTN